MLALCKELKPSQVVISRAAEFAAATARYKDNLPLTKEDLMYHEMFPN